MGLFCQEDPREKVNDMTEMQNIMQENWTRIGVIATFMNISTTLCYVYKVNLYLAKCHMLWCCFE